MRGDDATAVSLWLDDVAERNITEHWGNFFVSSGIASVSNMSTDMVVWQPHSPAASGSLYPC